MKCPKCEKELNHRYADSEEVKVNLIGKMFPSKIIVFIKVTYYCGDCRLEIKEELSKVYFSKEGE